MEDTVVQFSSVELLRRVWLFAAPWTVACQVSMSITNSQSLLQWFPSSGFFLMSRLFASGGQSIGASASASVLPMNIQDWFPLGNHFLLVRNIFITQNNLQKFILQIYGKLGFSVLILACASSSLAFHMIYSA